MTTLSLSKENIEALLEKNSAAYVYDQSILEKRCALLSDTFSVGAPSYKNYFAVKATPTPGVLSVIKESGHGMDCSSIAELILCEKIGISGEDIFFTANNVPKEEFKKAVELGAIINFDDISHIEYFQKHVGKLPPHVAVRFNPGKEKTGNRIIGDPAEAKFGMTREQVIDACSRLKKMGAEYISLHAMVCSNETDATYHLETADMLFALAELVHVKTGIAVHGINMGGGFGPGYLPDEKQMDTSLYREGLKSRYQQFTEKLGFTPHLFSEHGRFVAAPAGFLLAKVRHVKHTHKTYVGLTASMADLMRPGMYGAYHHISVLGAEGRSTILCDITGNLCENNDKFAIDRKLPQPHVGDVVVIHTVGAHGRAMGFNYNGKLRAGEWLLTNNGDITMIRRPETLDDYFATLEF